MQINYYYQKNLFIISAWTRDKNDIACNLLLLLKQKFIYCM